MGKLQLKKKKSSRALAVNLFTCTLIMAEILWAIVGISPVMWEEAWIWVLEWVCFGSAIVDFLRDEEKAYLAN